MSARALALPAVFAISLLSSVSTLPPSSAANAAECLSGPKGAPPAGSRWQYRTERPSMKKCWRLVQKDKAPAARTAAQDEADDEEPAPTPARPTVRAEPASPPPLSESWITRNVSGTLDSSQPITSSAPAAMAQAAETAPAPAAQEPPANDPPPVAEQPPVVAQAAPAAPPATAAQEPDGTPTLRLLIGALALLGFGACGVLFVMEMMRRRTDVLNTLERDDRFDDVPEVPAADAPTFAPLPPIGTAAPVDDVDETLRRVAQRRRRAA